MWDREKDVERLKERFQMPRALVQAKVAVGKYPHRSLHDAVSAAKTAAKGKIPVILVAMRSSVNNGKASIASGEAGKYSITAFADLAKQLSAAAVGVNVDTGAFRGVYEDLEEIKLATTG